jgi:hypothetical protein
MTSRDVVWEHGENHHPGCMHNYYYDIVCMHNYDIIHLVRFCDVLYIKLCIDHANIFINSSPENQKHMVGFPVFSVGLPPLPSGYRSKPSGLPIGNRMNWRLNWKFEFVR